MLTAYIRAAMHHAQYELMENGRFFGKIPECPGAWGEGATVEEARSELESALEGWILLGLQLRHHLPPIEGIDLNYHEEPPLVHG